MKKVSIPEGVNWAQLTPEQRAYKKALDAALKSGDKNEVKSMTSKRKVASLESDSDDDTMSSSSSSSSDASGKVEPPLKKAVMTSPEAGKKNKESLKSATTGTTAGINSAIGSALFNNKPWNKLTPAEKEEKKKLDAARNHSIAKEMATQDLQKVQEKKQQWQQIKGGGSSDSDSVSVSSDDVDKSIHAQTQEVIGAHT